MSIKQNVARAKTDYDEVYNAGKKSEYDAFWDIYQNYGKREVYARTFVGYGFTFDNFFPKYDIRPKNTAEYMFYFWDGRLPNHEGSLTARLNECGVVLDTSQCTSLSTAFGNSRFTEIPAVDFTGQTTNVLRVFFNTKVLTKIDKITVREDTTFSQWFENATALEEIRIEGVIGQGINFQSCPLSVDSMISIITHLKPLGAEEGFTKTVYFSRDCWDRLEASGIPNPYHDVYELWEHYVLDSLCWNT